MLSFENEDNSVFALNNNYNRDVDKLKGKYKTVVYESRVCFRIMLQTNH